MADKGLDRLVGQQAASIPSTARHLDYHTRITLTENPTVHIGHQIRSFLLPVSNQAAYPSVTTNQPVLGA
jgi:hypothetical protein